MGTFCGLLDRWTLRDADLELRFTVNFYPAEVGTSPIAYIHAKGLVEPRAIERRLAEIDLSSTEASFEDPDTSGELHVSLEEYDEPLVLRAQRIEVSYGPYELEDFERFTARLNASSDSLQTEVTELHRRIAEAKRLLGEQSRRVALKAEGHSKGTTARTLYEQQLSFISRLLGSLDR